MATYMEKDVLIEHVAFVSARMFLDVPEEKQQTEEFKKDRETLSLLKIKYLSSLPEELDYKKETEKIKSIRRKYKEIDE